MDEFDFDTAPPEFQEVRWLVQTIFLVSGSGWLINYFTTIRTAFRDRTSGVSLISLCNNLAWELLFVTVHRPPNPVAALVIGAWLFVNVFVIYATVKFARESKPDSVLLDRYLPVFVVLGILGFFSGHYALTVHIGPTKALYWGGMFCLVTLSASALGVLVQRGHTRGTSYAMWLSRFIASSFGVAGLFIRAYTWSSQWGWADNILMRWFCGTFFAIDVLYGICFWYTRRVEGQARLKQKRG